jgi:Txe/YoeB family toxin of Txe-Axe toxin-antitoxin module
MKKSEYYKENINNLITKAKEDLAELVGKVIDKYVPEDRSIEFHELGIGTPTYRDIHNVHEGEGTISGVWSRFDGKENKLVFTVNAEGFWYDVNMDDLDTDMIVYLLGEFENVTL